MARLPRISPVDVPVHIIQRGNNRQVCFVAGEDYSAYVDWLSKYSKKYSVDIHAWVLMANQEPIPIIETYCRNAGFGHISPIFLLNITNIRLEYGKNLSQTSLSSLRLLLMG